MLHAVQNKRKLDAIKKFAKAIYNRHDSSCNCLRCKFIEGLSKIIESNQLTEEEQQFITIHKEEDNGQ